MTDRGLAAAAGTLAVLAALAAAAPWLPLRDPAAQPDTLVLRDLAPGARVHAVALADGRTAWGRALRMLDDGSVELDRGGRLERIPRAALAGPDPVDWHRRPWFLLGTDGYGRDLLSRLVWGGRISLLVGLLGAALAIGLGTAVGTLAGTAGGALDALLMRLTDLALAVPRIFLVLLLVALYEPSLATTVVVLGGTTWMAAARLVRGEILSLRERDFVVAARAAGAGPLRLGLCHLLPGAAVPVLVEGPLRVGEAMLLEAALSFLGLGVRPPLPSWGNLIADGRHSLLDAWWVSTLPGLAIAATVLSLSVLAEAARERLAGRARASVPAARPALESPRGRGALVAGSAAR